MGAEQANYFNTPEYLDYLRTNFDLLDLSRERDVTCKRPDLELILGYTDRLGIGRGEELLEIGCGLGRLLQLFGSHYQVIPSGIDISGQAIQLAKERLPSLANNIKCATAERLPFSDISFNYILCWAVFDLTEQGEALAEMMRVLKPGGAILLTGKNNLFEDDDEDALIAEIKSREKGIPNHYTDYQKLRSAVELNGGLTEMEHFFVRRGDFMRGLACTERPDKFIEYCIVIRKKSHTSPVNIKVAESYSQSWKLLNG